MGKPWSRVTDMTTPCSLLCAPGCIHGPETNLTGNFTVFVEGKPGCHTTNIAIGCGPPANYVMGSTTVWTANQMVVRVGDPTSHGSTAMLGAMKVLVGG